MTSQPNRDDELLAKLIREAGDPDVSPDPRYAENLRAAILGRAAEPPAKVAVSTVREPRAVRGPRRPARKSILLSLISIKGTTKMERITRIAGAAIVLAAVGLLGSWLIGGSATIAFAEVAKVLENLRTATFDETAVVTDPSDGKPRTVRMKTMFLAPSHERSERLAVPDGAANERSGSVMIFDGVARKALTYTPDEKVASLVDLAKVPQPAGNSLNIFETVRQIVREGKTAGLGKVKSLGKKEIDGREAVGFQTGNNANELTIWADPQTARPVRIEVYSPLYNDSRNVMSNFQYDMDLDPSLFSLEPPAGYTMKTTEAAMPVEEDLINFLRLVAKHNDGVFPPAISMGKEYMQAIAADAQAEGEKLLQTPEVQKLREKVMAEHADDKEAGEKAFRKEWLNLAGSLGIKLSQTHMQGVLFFAALQPANGAHYAGKDVKIDTPDRPIFWYKPTGAEKYRVIYADLGVKELTPEEVKQFTK